MMRPLQSSGEECFAYFGEREGWLKFLGRHRDSDLLSESNFAVALERLGGEDDDAGVAVERFNHWAVGWTEVILIRPDAADKIARAEAMLAKMKGYPVLDEDDWSERECEAVWSIWKQAGLSERIEYCREAGESIFAARRDITPEHVFDYIRESLI